jgi:hypothetical protein
VAHKGFPREQNVVDAINEICRTQDGNELTCRQKEDFLQFIRGESDNSYRDFCIFWFTVLVLWVLAEYIWWKLPGIVYISVHIYHCFAEFTKPAPSVMSI